MRAFAVGVSLIILASAVSGCDYRGGQSLPLPGGVSGDRTYTVTVVLDDATNLVARESCRSNDTVVGSVESVEVDDQLRARIVCRIKDSVKLPANATATLRETSLLGERFVGIDPPAGQKPEGVLAPGSMLPAATTRVDPNVEMVLGALSQVLNGGGLGSLDTILGELNTALADSDLKGTLREVASLVGHLNANRSGVVHALDAMDRFSSRIARQRGVVARALDAIPSGLAVLNRQRSGLVKVLRKLSDLSRVAVPLIERSREATVADLKLLAPVLHQLTKQGRQLSATIERVTTFPFPSNAMSIIRGDYGGMYGAVTVDVDMLNELLGGVTTPATVPVPTGDTEPRDGQLTLPTVPGVDLDALLGDDSAVNNLLGGLLLGGTP